MFLRRDALKISLALSAMGLSAAPAFAQSTGEPEEKISCDILVIGSGIAGIVAALQAVEDGANVLMIDKAAENQRGGNSRVRLGSFLMAGITLRWPRKLYQGCKDEVSWRRKNRLVRNIGR